METFVKGEAALIDLHALAKKEGKSLGEYV